MKKSFASDNNAPVHETIFKAMQDANIGDTIAYGDDIFTFEAEQKFKDLFGHDTRVFFVFTGTGANVSGIAHLTHPYNSIVCAQTSHIHNDECGAPEKYTGCKVLTIPSEDGKIRTSEIKPFLHSVGFQHHSQPKVISITQATELGTVYSPDEIMEIARFAHQHDLVLHMDGARIANAAAHLGIGFSEMVSDTGVDLLSFGGTKNGMMMGEAVVFLNNEMAKAYEYTRKQSMQLASKMRYLSAQFNALLTNDLWLKNASHANEMAAMLAEKVSAIAGVKITRPVQTNAVFAAMPPEAIEKLKRRYFFYVWNEQKHEVRWMTAFNTTEQDIENFVKALIESLD